MRARALALLSALGLAVGLAAAAEERPAGSPPPAEPRAETRAGGACYLHFGQEAACVQATTQEQCEKACDERLCDEVVWYPKPGCWEWGWIGPSPR